MTTLDLHSKYSWTASPSYLIEFIWIIKYCSGGHKQFGQFKFGLVDQIHHIKVSTISHWISSSSLKMCQQHIFPWLSLTIHLYKSSVLVGLDGIYCLYWADESKFLLVGQYWCIHEYVFSMTCWSYVDGLSDWW